jgi:ligand-binding sensor domain-containing protein
MAKKPAVFFSLLLLPLIVYSLDPGRKITRYMHDTWGLEQGLPQNSVFTVVQTRDGYLWMGTQDVGSGHYMKIGKGISGSVHSAAVYTTWLRENFPLSQGYTDYLMTWSLPSWKTAMEIYGSVRWAGG